MEKEQPPKQSAHASPMGLDAMSCDESAMQRLPPPPFQLQTSSRPLPHDHMKPFTFGMGASANIDPKKGGEFLGLNKSKPKEWGDKMPEEGLVETDYGIGINGEGEFASGKTLEVKRLFPNRNVRFRGRDTKGIRGGEEVLAGPQYSVNGNYDVKVNRKGLKVSGGIDAEASLVSYERSGWFMRPMPVLGEPTIASIMWHVRGMIGVEGKAALDINLGKIAEQKDPKAFTKNGLFGAGAEVEGEVFAGAKIEGSLKAAYSWEKKPASAYVSKIQRNITTILDALQERFPKAVALLRLISPDKAAAAVIRSMFKLGAEGLVNLAEVMGRIEGTAGAGIHGSLKASFKGGKFKWHGSAGATWGLGIGGGVEVSMDILEGLLFGLVAGGELLARVIPFLLDRIDPAAIAEAAEMFAKEKAAQGAKALAKGVEYGRDRVGDLKDAAQTGVQKTVAAVANAKQGASDIAEKIRDSRAVKTVVDVANFVDNKTQPIQDFVVDKAQDIAQGAVAVGNKIGGAATSAWNTFKSWL